MKKKDYNAYLIMDFIIIGLKVLAGVFGHSLALLATILFDVVVIITSFIAFRSKEKTTRGRMVGTAFYSFIVCLLSIFYVFITFKIKIMKPSLLILIFLLLCLVLNYVTTVYKSNVSYSKKEGILGGSNKNSSVNIIMYIVVLASVIISKWGSLWKQLRYADRIGATIISLFTIYYALRILVRSFKFLEEELEEKLNGVITEEVNKCKEVKNITKINILSNGGIRKIDIDLKLQPGIGLTDLITFVVTLEDFLLKYCDFASVNLVKHINRSGARKNARNSGSTNSKKSTKKKSTKSKSKKR